MKNICRRHAVTAVLVLPTLSGALTSGRLEAQDVVPLQYNDDELVMMAVEGVIAPPIIGSSVYRISPDGEPMVFPGTGGITYNYRAGDSAVNIAADHVEPAVSMYAQGSSNDRNSGSNRALMVLSSIGNEARVLSGDAKGAVGRVIGKHGGIEHVMVDFPDEVYDDLSIGDEIQIRSIGTGLRLENVEGVVAMNISPTLMEALTEAGMGVTRDGTLRIPVTHRIPAMIMGSGLGRDNAYTGDYDIQLFDEEVFEEYNLGTLRFGDIVALIDADNTFGRIYRTGSISGESATTRPSSSFSTPTQVTKKA